MEAAYLFGGGVALLACFQSFQDFRHPPVPARNVAPKTPVIYMDDGHDSYKIRQNSNGLLAEITRNGRA
jgi:hypothetical protein